MNRLRKGTGPSPRYCGWCGAKLSEVSPNSCINDTPHESELEIEAARYGEWTVTKSEESE